MGTSKFNRGRVDRQHWLHAEAVISTWDEAVVAELETEGQEGWTLLEAAMQNLQQRVEATKSSLSRTYCSLL